MKRGINWLLLAVATFTNCARPGAPIGGPIDNVGPQVVGNTPNAFAVLEDFQGPIEVFFDERISETASSGSLQDAVRISPMLGEITVNHRSRSLEIEMLGGFTQDVVYRITILPIVRDLFQNPMPYPFEFLFSTGPEMIANVAAGTVTDGITLRPSFGATVIASTDTLGSNLESGDGLKHIAVSDSSGVYAFRYLPTGTYSITAFMDENRSNSPESTEPIANTHLVVQANDTVFTDMKVLRPDSTPPVLNAVGIVDSLTLLVEFDDYLDPEQFPVEDVIATLSKGASGTIEIKEILDEYEFDARRELISDAVGDSMPTVGLDSMISTVEPIDRGASVPSRNVYLLLAEPIKPGTAYEVTISGLVNVNGIGPSGGTGSVTRDIPERFLDNLRFDRQDHYER